MRTVICDSTAVNSILKDVLLMCLEGWGGGESHWGIYFKNLQDPFRYVLYSNGGLYGKMIKHSAILGLVHLQVKATGRPR